MPPTPKITDEQFILEYVTNGKGLSAISKEYSLRISGLGKRLDKLIRDGKIPAELREARKQATAPLVTREKLAELYEQKGVYSLSKQLGCNESALLKRLHRMGIAKSERQFKPSGLPRRERRKRSDEFLSETKRQRFSEERGCCEWCKKPIVGDWRSATYHHRTPVKHGGTREPENCMVLHQACHEDNFEALHGFSRDLLVAGYTSNTVGV